LGEVTSGKGTYVMGVKKSIWGGLLILMLIVLSRGGREVAAERGEAQRKAMSETVKIEVVAYKGWNRNLRLSNGTVELVITLEVGPRILRYGYLGGENVFKEYPTQMGGTGESTWQIRGGHRLWHAPEDDVRTYELDNGPVAYELLEKGWVRLSQTVEPKTGIAKVIELRLDETGTGVTVVHRLWNRGLWPVELAPWALSVMAAGGTAIVPLPPKIAHPGSVPAGELRDLRGFVPNQTLILWPFTDLADRRYRWGTRYLTLRQDDTATTPTKIGLAHRQGWVGYLNRGLLFVKSFDYQEGRPYTDGGSNFETFTNAEMLEIESLGPLETLPPGGSIDHREQWWLFEGLPDETSDEALDRHLRGRVDAERRQ
jgi:hypothetical protein